MRNAEEERRLRLELVSDLREARSRYPKDKLLGELLTELHAASADFAALWHERPARGLTVTSRTFLHPGVGPLTVDSDILTVRDSDLRLIVYTAPPASAAVAQLELLATSLRQPLAQGRRAGGEAQGARAGTAAAVTSPVAG
nr:hypothetical protein [Actinoplanes sp. RD1]